MSAEPTSEERAAVDGLAGMPQPGRDWPAGHRLGPGGVAGASANRHLLLPALQAVQGAVGWVSPGGLNYVCERLSVPPAEAYAVASFYALISTRSAPAFGSRIRRTKLWLPTASSGSQA